MFGDERRDLERKAKADGRLPPGQSLTLKWPVLHAGGVPHFDPAKWDFKITGLVQEPEAPNLGPVSTITADGSNFGFSLRYAMEPPRQSLEGRIVHGRDEAGCG